MVCTDPEGFARFLSRQDSLTGRIPLDDYTLNALYDGRNLNTLVSWLVIRYKS